MGCPGEDGSCKSSQLTELEGCWGVFGYWQACRLFLPILPRRRCRLETCRRVMAVRAKSRPHVPWLWGVKGCVWGEEQPCSHNQRALCTLGLVEVEEIH